MNRHADILDQHESLMGPLTGSVLAHTGMVALLVGFGWWQQHNGNQWGSQNPMGGAIGVTAVDKIPLPNRSITPNPVANDTDHSVPQKPEKVEARPVPKEDPDAVPLNPREKKPKKLSELAQRLQKYSPAPLRPNQLSSSSGPAINSPLYGKKGISGVGIGDTTVAGKGCGGYLELVRQRIQSKWDSQPVSNTLSSNVVLNMQVMRTGELRDITTLVGSRNSEVDFGARRAIQDASPFPPFMASCEGNDAKIEVRFEPKR
jgi:TonB family protein